MKFQFDDGGRGAAGYRGLTRDCATRAIAIATGLPYQLVYDAINETAQSERRGKRKCGISSARTGVYRQTMRKYLAALGWRWMPTMGIGTGCTVHLYDGELPMGRLIVSVSRHFTAVIDGVIHDTHNPQREATWIYPDRGQPLKPGYERLENGNGIAHVERRCVYGYWSKA